jgi:hypothetical protein
MELLTITDGIADHHCLNHITVLNRFMDPKPPSS